VKFASLIRGTRAERAAIFPLVRAGGETIECAVLLRPITDAEENDAHAFALAHAKSKGVAEPAPNQPIYDTAYMAHALASGILDPDSPATARTPFFADAKEVLDNLTRDQRVFLFELLDAFQDEVSPSVRKMSAEQMLDGCAVLAKGGTEAERFLDRLAPSTLRRFATFTGSQVWSSLERKSPTGSPPNETTSTSSASGPTD